MTRTKIFVTYHHTESQHCPEYNALVDATDDLCKALPIADLYSKLISERVIEFGDKEELYQEKTNQKMTEKFIEKHLCPEVRVGETKRFKKFMNVMKSTDKCHFLVERIEERVKHYASGKFLLAQRVSQLHVLCIVLIVFVSLHHSCFQMLVHIKTYVWDLSNQAFSGDQYQ